MSAGNGNIDVTITGGNPSYITTWSNGATTEDLIGISAGEYVLHVVDQKSCTDSIDVVISQPDPIYISFQTTEVSGVYPYTYLWNNGGTSNHIDSIKPASYSLLLTDANGCKANFNFVVDESEVKCVEMPNTITPNGDNYNDTWIIKNLDLYPNASVKIFNKWGNLLYDSKGKYKPWDGTYNNQPLPSEVYYYIIVLGNADDDQYTGTITIIR